MQSRTLPLGRVFLAGLVLAACRGDQPAANPNVVTVTTSDFAFAAPAEVPAGLTTFRLVNQGPSMHHVQLVQLHDGKTVDDFMAALQAGGPPPPWATVAGGPNPPELGATATTTVALEPGNYAMVCFIPTPEGVPHLMHGMVRALTVTPAPAVSPAEPAADLVMKLVDFDFDLSQPLTAGRHTIRVENAGAQPHEVALVRLQEGKTPMDFAHYGESQSGPAPGALFGGVSAIMPGTHAFVEVDLEPGEYGLICFIPEMRDGKPHFMHGMIKQITVS